MKKITFLKSLLVAAALLVGGNAWATPTVIKSYDFDAATAAVSSQTVLASSGTTSINKITCDNLTGDFAGIAVQGNGNWHIYHTNSKGVLQGNGFYNNNGGGRLLGLVNLKAGDIVTITAGGGLPTSATNGTYDSANSTAGTNCIYTVDADGNFAVSVTRYNYIHTITVTRDLADIENPTYTITGANGVQRQLTLACLTDGSVIKWNTVNDKSADGWTTYSTPFLTSETTLYAYAEKAGNTSEVITITTGAGTTVTLNAPSINRSGNTVTITSDQSNTVGNPSTDIYYTYGDGDPVKYTSAITVVADATITAYATATGYTNSNNVTRAVALFPTSVPQIINAPQNNTYTTGALSGVDVVGTNATFQALIIDGVQWGGKDVFVQSTNFGFRNGGAGKDWYFNSTSNVWLLIKNMKAGDIVVAKTTYQASSLANATYTEKYSEGNNFAYTVTADGDVELAFKKINSATMHYIYGLYVYGNRNINVSVTADGYATLCPNVNLDFTSATAIEACKASVDGEGKITYTPVNTVKAGEGVLLRSVSGGAANEDIPVIASADANADNAFVGIPAKIQLAQSTEAGYTNYILSKKSDVMGFYKVNAAGSWCKAGSAYLKVADALAPARGFFALDEEETTGICDKRIVKIDESANATVFDLQGRRVAQPRKGLYINNGRKVVIK